MSHLSMETLVALREPGTEPGEAAAREHLEGCPLCRAEFDRLHQRVARLKALPALRPSRERWPTVLSQVRVERRRRRFRAGGPKESGPDRAQIQQAMVRSQVLESALDRFDPESRVMDGQTLGIAQELEDRIARVDRELEMAELMEQQARDAQLLRLWRERVGLLDALVDVHVTRASNAGL